MHIPTQQSESITLAALTCRDLTDNLIENLLPCASPLEFSASTNIFLEQPSTRLFRVSKGFVNYTVRGKLVTVFEEGDLVGLARSLNLTEGIFSCSEPCTLIPFDRDELVNHVNTDAKRQKNWAYYLICSQSVYHQALAQEIRADFQPQAGFLHFEKGEVIINQGDGADKVYALLEGSADALCNNIKVGEVHTGETFGALAIFTRKPRMASVIATSDCLVLAIRKEEFVDLIGHQPKICINLIEEMATKINQLNTQLSAKQ